MHAGVAVGGTIIKTFAVNATEAMYVALSVILQEKKLDFVVQI